MAAFEVKKQQNDLGFSIEDREESMTEQEIRDFKKGFRKAVNSAHKHALLSKRIMQLAKMSNK